MADIVLMQKAIQIADYGSMVRKITSTRWAVSSQKTQGTEYAVDLTESGMKCSCPYG